MRRARVVWSISGRPRTRAQRVPYAGGPRLEPRTRAALGYWRIATGIFCKGARFNVTRVIPTESPASVVEALPQQAESRSARNAADEAFARELDPIADRETGRGCIDVLHAAVVHADAQALHGASGRAAGRSGRRRA